MRRHDRPSQKQEREIKRKEELGRLLEKVGRILDAQKVPTEDRMMYDPELDAVTRIPHD